MDNYKVLSYIARGSFGKVYKVRSNKDSNVYALKKILLERLDKYEKEAMITEIKLLLFHEHTYLLKANDIFVEEGNLHIITPFAPRIDVGEYIRAYKRKKLKINEKKIWKILCELMLSTNYLHQHSIIHRDIKAKNILFCENYEIYLGDFGVSKILPPTKIHTNTQIGTPYYLSPELISGNRYTSSIDVWAIGCVLYELMFGILPYEAQNIYQLYYKIKNNSIVIPESEYSIELKGLLRELLNKNEYRRPTLEALLNRPFIKNKIDYYSLIVHRKNIHREIFLQNSTSLPSTTYDWKNLIRSLMEDKLLLESKIKDQTFNLNHEKYNNVSTKLPPITPTQSSKMPLFKPKTPLQKQIPVPDGPPKNNYYRPRIIDYKKKLPELSVPSSRYMMPCLRKKCTPNRKYPTPPIQKDNQPLKFFY
jgi:serine/threonine protein kinase